MEMDSFIFEVVITTYQEYVVGYKVVKADKTYSFEPSFAVHSHAGSIRCIAKSEKYMATGGADDRIVIYDMISRKERSALIHHEGTINDLKFTSNGTHLLSVSDDGSVAITRTDTWILEKVWKKAKSHNDKPVYRVAVHPSDKLALTLGGDTTLKTWNLVKGRLSYTINLNSKSEQPKLLQILEWSHGGQEFLLAGGNHVEVWSIDTGGIVDVHKFNSKVSCAIWTEKDDLFVGLEDGTIVLKTKDGVTLEQKAHEGRVRCLQTYGKYVATASSNGELKLWTIINNKLKEKCSVFFDCRPTCMVIFPQIAKDVQQKQQLGEAEVEVTESPQTEPSVKKKKRIQNEVEVEISEPSQTKKKKRQLSEVGIEVTEPSQTKKKKRRQLGEVEVEISEPSQTKKKKRRQLREVGIEVTEPLQTKLSVKKKNRIRSSV